MIKIFQTIVDKDHGNCMQAAFASLLELPIDSVPNFIESKEGWFSLLWNLLKENGYQYEGVLHNYNNNKRLYPNDKAIDRFNELKDMDGVNGYFYATVYSPKYYNSVDAITHAVLIDKNFNIVHHTNSEYNDDTKYPESDIIGYNGIVNIFMINPIEKV